MRRVKGNLLKTLTSCGTQECKDAMQKYKINEMKVEAEFDKVNKSSLKFSKKDLIIF